MGEIDKTTADALLEAAARVFAKHGEAALPRVRALCLLAAELTREPPGDDVLTDEWRAGHRGTGHVAFAAFNAAVLHGLVSADGPLRAVAFDDETADGAATGYVVLGTDPGRVALLALRQMDRREALALDAARKPDRAEHLALACHADAEGPE